MPRLMVTACLAAAALAIGAAGVDAATVSSLSFRAPTLTTRWALDNGDCASVVSISRVRSVDAYGFFTRRHYTWPVGNCLALSNAKTFTVKDGVYHLRAHPLPPATYYVQIQYCHDSDLPKRGNYYCRGSNALPVRIPGASR